MTSRFKEDEKNERMIRGLLKLTPNRRCVNCNSLGPQYVCTNFWTFVCTNCSGIHREFTHRVKSVSMAKFTAQEVSALREGGNQHAKEIYFKEWDPQRHSLPDSNNVARLREFIKHIYVDGRFTGERTYDKPGGRSPGYDQENRQYDYKSSPGRPPIINDWRREDRFGDGRKFENHRISDGGNKVESQSPERSKDQDSSSLPVGRPVRDILGENVVPLRISEPPKTNNGQAANGSALTQRTASSSSLASSNGTPVEVKIETIKSLIDFDDDPEPPVAPAIPQSQQTNVAQLVMAANSSDNNWASFDVVPEAKVSQGSSNVNPLESVMSHQQPLFSTVTQPITQQSTLSVGGALNNQGHPAALLPHSSHHISNSKPVNEGTSSVVSQPSTIDIKPSGRNVLPEDLFSLLSFPAPAPGWQMGPPHAMDISNQYNNLVSVPSLPQPSKSMNPFDLNNEPATVQAPTLPSMSSLQGALPSVSPSATLHPSSMGNLSFPWKLRSSSHVSALHPRAQTLSSATGPRAHMGQHVPTNVPMPRYQGIENFGNEGAAFGFSNPDQHLTGRLVTPATSNPFPAIQGNPFG